MRLLTRLSLSHSIPVLLVASALALLLAALVQMSVVLSALNNVELGTLRDEGALHRAMWGLDVAMRHADDDCGRGLAPASARARIQEEAEELQVAMGLVPAATKMLPLAREYLQLAGEVVAGPACEVLVRTSLRDRREGLDERLTDMWVERLAILHAAVNEKEERARRIGVSAAWLGLTLTVASIALALLVARRIARVLSRPLTRLSDMARRVGMGDFETPVAVEGPPEVRALAADLEAMRQQLAQLDALKQGFVASVSHELRTPLSKIKEALSLLQDGVVGELEPRQVRVLQIARQACEREIRMVSTLLDLSRLRSGSPLRPREGTAIDGIIQAALEGERSEAEARGAVLETQLDGEAPLCSLDSVLLERAIANLVRNAIAVSSKGERVVVRRRVVEATTVRPRCIEVAVIDEGPGVPDAIADLIFDAFVTHAVPKVGKSLGVGLGLALAREIARAHGGDLQIDKTVAAGATFLLWLPLNEKTMRATAPASSTLETNVEEST